ncbi:MAG TPA: kelch repeat-containing protein [Solirubrobacteraceae bacterium]|nr:kelch repeat-containing protein [Solirubrobacteraceae bacterium]
MLVVLALASAAAVSGCGGGARRARTSASAPASTSAQRAHAAGHRRPRSVALTYRRLFALGAPLRDPASAGLPGGRFALLGGLDAADTSTAGIELADLRGVTRTASLPIAQHDAQAARLGANVYVFGGGSYSELDHILRFDPSSGAVDTVGSLPGAQSDVAVAALAGTAYVVGGFDGTSWRNTILAWRPGSAAKLVGRLPVGLRYAAVAAASGRLIIIGGSTPAAASDAIDSFDPATGRVRRIGTLPQPVTHAGAATLGSTVYLVGGRGDALDAQTARVWAIDPLTGRVRAAGRLPQPLSDAGVLRVGRGIVVAGGLASSGATVAGVGELLPRR